MIQAPNFQYIPAQQPIQVANQPQGAINPVQYTQQQTPGVIYNYPTTSCYMPQQTPYEKSQFNGVNIEIINPQGQGISPYAQNTMPVQYATVAQPGFVSAYPQMVPMQVPYPMVNSQAIVQAPQQQAPVVEQTPAPQIPAPVVQQVEVQPQAPVVAQTPVAQTPAPVVQTPVQQAQPVVQTPVQAQTPVADTTVADAQTAATFAGKLNTTDLEAQKTAIEEIAENVKTNDAIAPALLDTQIFDALVGIINKDTSTLQGPTQEIIELRQKPQDKLTEADKVKASTPTPLEQAERNKQYALYTIAYMQERLNNELVKRGAQPLPLKDLPNIEEVINTAKSNQNPMLRIGALASLSHIARPEYKADLTTIFDIAKADEDTRVQDAANKALASLSNIQ